MGPDGGHVEVVQLLFDVSTTVRGKDTWAYSDSGIERRWDEAKTSARLVSFLKNVFPNLKFCFRKGEGTAQPLF